MTEDSPSALEARVFVLEQVLMSILVLVEGAGEAALPTLHNIRDRLVAAQPDGSAHVAKDMLERISPLEA